MFNCFAAEITIICAACRGSYKLQNTFLKIAQTFWIVCIVTFRLFYSITAEGKKWFLKKLYLKWKQAILLDDLAMAELVSRAGVKITVGCRQRLTENVF